MASTRDFRALWDFGNPQATESVFRERIADTDVLVEKLLLETQVARTYGLRDRFAEAHALLDAIEANQHTLRDTAAASDLTELHVRCLLERGRVFRSSKCPAEAQPLFVTAANEAQAAGMDELAIDAMHMVALVVPPTEAIQWTTRGFELAQQSIDPNARNWDAPLANNLGWTYHDMGDFVKALAYFEQALAARVRIGKPEPIRIGKYMVARAYRSLQKYDDALQLLLSLDPMDSHGYVHEEIGENYTALGRPSDAKPHFLKAHAVLQHDKSVDAKRLARMLFLTQ
ncbi:hypothetical protein ACHHYP_05250 [Achlya hypogyna]|uniref:Uncharacterized protein n=1 Tax=Achlya hypogyna TaxID=1202772 RepID=A0A1V9YYI8_ACHHY|nr:hypothetical protein ACHHYP_05250 [Achlya hypogyna]